MSIVDILVYPDPRLKAIAKPVVDYAEPRFQSMIDDMLETLLNTERCGGLAAAQLDIADPYRIFVFYDFDEEDPEQPSEPMVAVNPEILLTEGTVLEKEGCMSVYPNAVQAPVTRPKKTTMRACDREGNTFEITRTGYLAKLLVHEVDHLNGKLYIDHLKPLKRKMVDNKITKVKRSGHEG